MANDDPRPNLDPALLRMDSIVDSAFRDLRLEDRVSDDLAVNWGHLLIARTIEQSAALITEALLDIRDELDTIASRMP